MRVKTVKFSQLLYKSRKQHYAEMTICVLLTMLERHFWKNMACLVEMWNLQSWQQWSCAVSTVSKNSTCVCVTQRGISANCVLPPHHSELSSSATVPLINKQPVAKTIIFANLNFCTTDIYLDNLNEHWVCNYETHGNKMWLHARFCVREIILCVFWRALTRVGARQRAHVMYIFVFCCKFSCCM